MTAPGLQVHGDLWLGQPGRGRAPLVAGLALDVPAGRWSALLGASGVGKSTLARLIAGLPGPQTLAGELAATDGQPLSGRVALMAQEPQVLPWLDLVENVVIGARLRGQRPDVARARALLEQVGLGAMTHRRPAALSGGQRQRLVLARTLAEDRVVVVLDEPFAALDLGTRLAMQDLTARLLAGRTVVLITHDPAEAVRMADAAWLLTPQGATDIALPPEAAPRDLAAPAVLAAQAALIGRLTARCLA